MNVKKCIQYLSIPGELGTYPAIKIICSKSEIMHYRVADSVK